MTHPLIGASFPHLGVTIDAKPPVPAQWLLGLRPTNEIIDDLEKAKVRGNPGVLADLEFEYGRAKQRDRIQVSRPKGCWCLGLGRVRVAMAVPPSHPHEGNPLDWYRFCPCEDGAESKNEVLRLRERSLRGLAAARFDRLWSGAGVPKIYESFDMEHINLDPLDAPILGLCSEWVAKNGHDWLYMSGNLGTGKTTLAVAVLKECVKQGRKGMFVKGPMLLAKMKETYREDSEFSELDYFEQLLGVDVLLVDDLGSESKVSPWVGEKLTTLIDQAAEREVTLLVTSNTGLKELPSRIFPRAADRLRERALDLQFRGQDKREAAFQQRSLFGGR